MAGTVDRDHKPPGEAPAIQRFHPDESANHVRPQGRQRRRPEMPQEVVQRAVHRQRHLLGAREPIHVRQHLRGHIAQVKVQLAPAPQLAAKQQEAPPDEKPFIVVDEGGEAGVGQRVQPGAKLGPEVLDGPVERLPQRYGRPARRFRAVTCPLTCASASSVRSRISCYNRRCSAIHSRTSSTRSVGTYTVRVLPATVRVR